MYRKNGPTSGRRAVQNLIYTKSSSVTIRISELQLPTKVEVQSLTFVSSTSYRLNKAKHLPLPNFDYLTRPNLNICLWQIRSWSVDIDNLYIDWDFILIRQPLDSTSSLRRIFSPSLPSHSDSFRHWTEPPGFESWHQYFLYPGHLRALLRYSPR